MLKTLTQHIEYPSLTRRPHDINNKYLFISFGCSVTMQTYQMCT